MSKPQRPAIPGLSKLDTELLALARELWGSGQTQKAPVNGSLDPAELNRAATALISLQRGLTDKRSRIGTAYMEEAEALAAYLLFYWQTSHAQMHGLVYMAMNAVEPGTWPWANAKGARVLDLGSGPGPAGIALAEALGLARATLAFCDRSPLACSCARSLGEARGHTVHTLAPWMAGQDPIPKGPHDFIIFSHVLNEIATNRPDCQEQRIQILEAAMEQLAPGGALLLLEPALLSTSRELLVLRDHLAARGMRPLAPCFQDGPCPALAEENQSCHSEFPPPQSAIVEALSRKTGLDRSAVKSCCFFFMRTDEAPVRVPAWRVVSEQRLNKAGRSRVSLCGPEAAAGVATGHLATDKRRASRAASTAANTAGVNPRFTLSAAGPLTVNDSNASRPIARSDQVIVENPEIRETGWGLGPETRLILCKGSIHGGDSKTRS